MKITKYFIYAVIATVNIILSLIILLNTEEVVSPEQCFVGGGCSLAQNSIYSSIFGIPLTYMGIIGFSFILLAILFNKRALNYLILIAGIFSLWLVYVQFFILKQICNYCIVVDILTLIMFFTMVFYYFKD